MAIQKTPRAGLDTYGLGSDPHPNRSKFNEQTNLLDRIMALAEQGATNARPAAGKYGRFYWDTSVKRLYWDDGAAWQEVTTNGGGGAGGAIVPGAAAVEGVSNRSARADHTHALALATAAVDGAMGKADKALLDASTNAATANTLVKRDGGGRFQAAAPSLAADVANKTYVDGQVGTSAPLSHSHSGADITTGTISPLRIANATALLDGLMPKADKAKLDAATSAAVAASTVVMRTVGGHINAQSFFSEAAQSTASTALTRKDYVDGKVWDGADITTGTFSDARIANAAAAKDGLMPKADKVKLDAATVLATPNTLAMRNSAGQIQVATPGSAPDAANKGYVDGLASDYAPAVHSHSWAQVTSKPTTFAPVVGYTATVAKPGSWLPDWSEVEGKPSTFAPSSHTHDGGQITGTISPLRIANATALLDGLMPKADKAKLDGLADNYATADHTHSWGAISGKPSTFTPATHTHSGADITTGTISDARIANATAVLDGLMSKADKTKLDKATSITVADALVMRDAAGRARIVTPINNDDIANLFYVEKRIGEHAHSWGQITNRPTILGYAELDARYPQRSHSHWWSDITNTNVIYNTNAAWGSYRAVWVNDSGVVGYNLSSEKYKTNIVDYVVPLDLLGQVTPKRFNYKGDVSELGDAAPVRVNFIAEHLHDAGLTEYVSYDGKGTGRENVETINEQLIVNALWSFAQQHNSKIADLEQRLAKGGL